MTKYVSLSIVMAVLFSEGLAEAKLTMTNDSINSVKGIVYRLLPERANDFNFEVIESQAGLDVFEIESYDNKLIIRGNNGLAMAMGLNWYLKYYCHCHVSWCGNQLNLPESLPIVKTKVRNVTWAKYRYFLNYCCFGYSLPWWDWPQWERLIDWMALNGINAPLAITGQEAVWQAVCNQLGMSEKQTTEFLAGPPYLPFQWMGCLDGHGGPLPKSWIDKHEELGKKILERERSFGMKPILQGFTGHVPPQLKQIFPESKLHEIQWGEWTTYLLDPLDEKFSEIAKLYMQEQNKRFGTDHYYAADTFIEMIPPKGDSEYLDQLGKAIYQGMSDTDPEAVWVLQGWMFGYKKEFWNQPRVKAFLDSVPDDNMLVLDLFCEGDKPQWSRTEAFCGKPWLWCNVYIFGDIVEIGGGTLKFNNTDLNAARKNSESGRLMGLGFVNEGLGYNPIDFDLMYEIPWRDQAVNLKEWIKNYTGYRYGKNNNEASESWIDLQQLIIYWQSKSAIDIMPSLNKIDDGTLSKNLLSMFNAWQKIIKATDELGHIDTFDFDLVNITRAALSNYSIVLHHRLIDAHSSGDIKAFNNACKNFLQLMLDVDELLGTRKEFLLGAWLEDAKRWGDTDAEQARMQWNARRILTLWCQTACINDYARKQWSGMISGYYHKRWEMFFNELSESLANDSKFDNGSFNEKLIKWMDQWSDQPQIYPNSPKGSSVEVAKKLWNKYSDEFKKTIESDALKTQ